MEALVEGANADPCHDCISRMKKGEVVLLMSLGTSGTVQIMQAVLKSITGNHQATGAKEQLSECVCIDFGK